MKRPDELSNVDLLDEYRRLTSWIADDYELTQPKYTDYDRQCALEDEILERMRG